MGQRHKRLFSCRASVVLAPPTWSPLLRFQFGQQRLRKLFRAPDVGELDSPGCPDDDSRLSLRLDRVRQRAVAPLVVNLGDKLCQRGVCGFRDVLDGHHYAEIRCMYTQRLVRKLTLQTSGDILMDA